MKSALSIAGQKMNPREAFRHNLSIAIADYPDTFQSICDRAGYNRGYVRKVLTSVNSNPTLLFVECMAGALDIDPLDLLGERR